MPNLSIHLEDSIMRRPYKNPLFILGYPRSGTTLLRALLGSHTKIHLIHEPELIFGMRAAGISISERIKREDYPYMVEQLRKIGMCRRHLSTLPPKTLSELLDYPEDLSFKEVYEFLLPKPEEVEIWGEKSLGNVFYIPEIHKLYPNAIFVHIVRDPKGAILSHYRKRFAGSADCLPGLERKSIRFFTRGALLWKQWLNAVKTSQDLLGDRVIVQLRYEDLVREPERELRRICACIGVEFEPEMMDASRRKNDPVISSGVYGSYAHKNLNQPINAKRANADNELPNWATYIIEKYATNDLEGLGFGLKKESINILEKIRIKAELLLAEKEIRLRINKEIENRKGLTRVFGC